MRRRLQLIFQDPIASLNPRRCIGDIVAEPLVIAGVTDKAERERRVREVLVAVGLDPDNAIGRLPHEFSGGQCQRICIARALILEPELVICDEPVSALDVSIRAQILNLLEEMKRRYGLTLLFIAHDLAVVKAVSDRIAVMYLGKLCEVGPTERLFAQPAHPYTALLLEAIPVPDPTVAPRRQRRRRRAAVAARPALRLPLPHPLPARRRALRRRGAGAARDRRAASSPPAIILFRWSDVPPAKGRRTSGAPRLCAPRIPAEGSSSGRWWNQPIDAIQRISRNIGISASASSDDRPGGAIAVEEGALDLPRVRLALVVGEHDGDVVRRASRSRHRRSR